MMAEVGVKAVGLSGKDAEMIRVKKRNTGKILICR